MLIELKEEINELSIIPGDFKSLFLVTDRPKRQLTCMEI